jgi:hypothetical protein
VRQILDAMMGFVSAALPQVLKDPPTTDRRAARRYAIELALEYRVFRHKRAVHTGRGLSVNVSSKGILFECERPLPLRCTIELAIGWSARLHQQIGLTMWVEGATVRRECNRVAVRIRRYEFRTRGMSKGLL